MSAYPLSFSSCCFPCGCVTAWQIADHVTSAYSGGILTAMGQEQDIFNSVAGTCYLPSWMR